MVVNESVIFLAILVFMLAFFQREVIDTPTKALRKISNFDKSINLKRSQLKITGSIFAGLLFWFILVVCIVKFSKLLGVSSQSMYYFFLPYILGLSARLIARRTPR